MPFTVIIADDHLLVRDSIRRMIGSDGRFDIVGEAGDGVSAVTLVKSLQPDLLILDVAMPHATGVEVIEETRRWSPGTKIAVVTGVGSRGMLQHVFDAGVEGIFLKTGETGGWVRDFLAICEGGRRISSSVLELVDDTGKTALTGRERQILFGIARGETNAAIADRLGISANTVDKHRTKIMRKLGVHSVAELVARAFREGLLDDASHQ